MNNFAVYWNDVYAGTYQTKTKEDAISLAQIEHGEGKDGEWSVAFVEFSK